MQEPARTGKAERPSLVEKIFANAHREAEESRADGADYKVMLICVIAAVSLTMIHYLGNFGFVLDGLNSFGLTRAAQSINRFFIAISNERLAGWTWWVLVTVIFYFILPALIIRVVLGEPLASYGLRLKGAFKDYYLYIIMLIVMVPLVLLVSTTSSFQARYPFYHMERAEPLAPYFWQWELCYFLQFFSLEFFFRGFMTHGLKHRFGYYSVFVMSVPYCMIHFQKPMPEALAAIIAGIVLGTLSLKSRSILLGVAIHYSVAISMDLAALWRKGMLW
jgi:hypothetical protein